MVANPAAGPSRRRDAGEAAARGAARAGAEVALYRTTGPGDAERAAREAVGRVDLVVAAGGDGTAHEVANGVAGTGLALGVAPAGTMNLLARLTGTPLDPAAAAERIVAGSTRLQVSPGRANGRLFLLMAGAGFDAWVLRALLSDRGAKVRFRDYAAGAARGLMSFPFPTLAIATGGEALAAHSAIVGRAPLYGGFLRPTPHARLGGDALELCALAGGRGRLLPTLARMWSGAHGAAPGVTLRSVRRVTVAADRSGLPYQLDGELAGELPLAIDVAVERPVVLAVFRSDH